MAVTDFFVGEFTTELIKQLIKVVRTCSLCRETARQLLEHINQLHPIIQEIKYSGVEQPQLRQTQLDRLSETLRSGLELSTKVLLSNRWNVYKNLQYARKMEKLEKAVARFLSGPLQAHILADVHHLRVGVDRLVGLEERVVGLMIGESVGGSSGSLDLEEVMRRKAEEEESGVGGMVSLVGGGMVLGKKKVRDLVVGREDLRVVGICGIGGSGKTTLAKEISKDPQVRRHYNNKIFFLTVSQSADVEQLRQKLRAQIAGNDMQGISGGRSLVILDDVWSLCVLEELICTLPGCKTIVVSRFRFRVFDYVYEVELLKEDEAMSLFCCSAFGQKSVPLSADKNLVEQVVNECKGLPLALKVIGASLRDRPQMYWIGAKNRLSRGEAMCDSHEIKLLERMAISIKCLPSKVKECFLDLASFPEDKKIPLDVLINMWVELHDIDEEEAFAILVELSDKNLITLVNDSRAGETYSSYFEISVTQHDVLRDMALYCSNRASLNERQRLVMPRREDGLPKEWERNMDKPFQAQIVSIHTDEMGECDWFSMEFPNAEVLILNFSANEYYLPPFVDNMPKLRALVLINYGNSTTALHNLSVFSSMGKLKSLWLEKVIVPSLPNTVAMSTLRKISFVLCEFSNSLHGSLLDIPSMLPCLSELTMDHCIKLSKLSASICSISSLRSLSITNCHDLHDLPDELGKLNSLLILRFCACPALENLPDSMCAMERLKYLDISQCVNLKSLPEQIGGLIRLEKMDMRECSKITDLPASAVTMKKLGRVICDEEVSWLWREVERVVPDLQVVVAEESFDLNYLSQSKSKPTHY